MSQAVKINRGQEPDLNGKCICQKCGKKTGSINFYTYKDGRKCEKCKSCLTMHVDNFNPETFIWILKKFDVPYIPEQWNALRDRAFAKNPYKMNGLSVIGKYLAKMRLNQWKDYGYADTERLMAEHEEEMARREQLKKEQREKYEAELKVKLSENKISQAQYDTLISTETRNKEIAAATSWGNAITGINAATAGGKPPSTYEQALQYSKNPFQQQGFISQDQLIDPGADLTKEDKIYLALKWGRLYRPSQWITLEQLYNQFMNSFDIQGAARIDTLKMICKTSLKMNQAIDCGDIDSYQKLSRVYDAMMKSAKFTEAQNKGKDSDAIDSASAIVDFVEAHSGQIPRYECNQPQDIVDKIILDLKEYNRSLIYEDKSLAQEIQKYLQQKRISEQMKKDRQEAREKGLDDIELKDEDYVAHKEALQAMRQHDTELDEEIIEKEYQNRRVNPS